VCWYSTVVDLRRKHFTRHATNPEHTTVLCHTPSLCHSSGRSTLTHPTAYTDIEHSQLRSLHYRVRSASRRAVAHTLFPLANGQFAVVHIMNTPNEIVCEMCGAQVRADDDVPSTHPCAASTSVIGVARTHVSLRPLTLLTSPPLSAQTLHKNKSKRKSDSAGEEQHSSILKRFALRYGCAHAGRRTLCAASRPAVANM
jgi:hypothetical protein